MHIHVDKCKKNYYIMLVCKRLNFCDPHSVILPKPATQEALLLSLITFISMVWKQNNVRQRQMEF
jgi:hypothetical protein